MINRYPNVGYRMDSIQVLIKDNEICLIGVLTFNTTPTAFNLIKKHLENGGEQPQSQIVLNLHDITRSDSSGLTVLSGIMREAKKNNVTLQIRHIPKKLFNLARLSGLDSILPLAE